jgi:DNA-binding NarL/FixJ family response regulator
VIFMDDLRPKAFRPSVVLADDHPQTALEIERLLREDFEVVGVVGNGAALVSIVEILRPDAVVTDIAMPEMDGLEAARRLAVSCPGLPVVFVSCHDDAGIARRALSIGSGTAWRCLYVVLGTHRLPRHSVNLLEGEP